MEGVQQAIAAAAIKLPHQPQMRGEMTLRDEICRLGRSLFERGLTAGSSGNISVRLSDGGWLMTPTNASLGFLDPASLSLLDPQGRLVSGHAPTKEQPLHTALYDTRRDTGTLVNGTGDLVMALARSVGAIPDVLLPPLDLAAGAQPDATAISDRTMAVKHGISLARRRTLQKQLLTACLQARATSSCMTRPRKPASH